MAFLRAQKRDLERLLEECDPDDVSRIGFESRLEAVNSEIAQDAHEASTLAEVTLLFRGAPVLGSRGIEATFAGKTAESFQKVVSKMAAARSGRKIGSSGPIPGAADSRLFLTSTALGSFGLVLRELSVDQSLIPTPLAEAVQATTKLLAHAAGSDEDFADAAMETDAAVLDELDSFLSLVNDSGATLRVLTHDATAVLDDADTIAAAIERTHHREVEEERTPQRGVLLGVLPDSGWFELRNAEGDVLRGRLGRTIDPRTAQKLAGQAVQARITTITITRRGRETKRFVLESVEPEPPANT